MLGKHSQASTSCYICAGKSLVLTFQNFYLGATPLEAIAAGTAYINPVYKTTKYLHENSVYERLSQHTFAQDLGAPYVYNITRCARVGQRQDRWRGHSPSLPPIWLLLLLICTALISDILMVHKGLWEKKLTEEQATEEQVQRMRGLLHLRAQTTEEPVQGMRG